LATIKTNQPILSIILVNWNTRGYLERCLESIFASDLPESEVIVVDNDSHDRSTKMVEEDFPSVIQIKNPSNRGFAKACNQGISQSRGNYLAFLNTDILIFKDTFSEILRFMDSHIEVSMVGPKILSPDGTIQRSFMRFPNLRNTFFRAFALDKLFNKSKIFGEYLMTYFTSTEPAEIDILNGCFWVVRREAVANVGPLDERFFIYSEDKDWCKRFWDKGLKIIYLPSSSAIHFEGGSSSLDSLRFNREMLISNIKYWNKHFGKFKTFIYKNILLLHYLFRYVAFSLLCIKDDKFKSKKQYNMHGLSWMIKTFF